MMDDPRWAEKWKSPSKPVPGFSPGGPAPQWTEEELVFAIAGDPSYLYSGQGSKTSPRYGRMGGSPLFRLAKRVARHYNKMTDDFITDLFSNGMITLVRMMKPGFDEARGSFIPFVMRQVQNAMEHGVGGTGISNAALGHETEAGVIGFKGLLNKQDPNEIRAAANKVKGKYREESRHDKDPGNSHGKYSPAFYRLANQYADAIESGDGDNIERVQNQIRQMIDQIEDDNVFIGGASTGLGQAISTPDRKTSINIASMDAPVGPSGRGMAGDIEGEDDGDSLDRGFDPQTIKQVLDIAMNYDLESLIGNIPKYATMAKQWGAKKGRIGGKMVVNELRYIIRTLGPLGSNYPGAGNVRTNNKTVPRDAKNWWEPGVDPELEPIPGMNATWRSSWIRQGYPSMGPTDISREMTKEVMEFNKLRIPTARQIKVKGDTKEVVGKVYVRNTILAATIKLRFIAMLERDSLGINWNADPGWNKGGSSMESKNMVKYPILEEIANTDKIDRLIIAETCEAMCAKLYRVLKKDADPRYNSIIPGWQPIR